MSLPVILAIHWYKKKTATHSLYRTPKAFSMSIISAYLFVHIMPPHTFFPLFLLCSLPPVTPPAFLRNFFPESSEVDGISGELHSPEVFWLIPVTFHHYCRVFDNSTILMFPPALQYLCLTIMNMLKWNCCNAVSCFKYIFLMTFCGLWKILHFPGQFHNTLPCLFLYLISTCSLIKYTLLPFRCCKSGIYKVHIHGNGNFQSPVGTAVVTWWHGLLVMLRLIRECRGLCWNCKAVPSKPLCRSLL